jgi:DNA polymerase/3'-5' exonuclease PolX
MNDLEKLQKEIPEGVLSLMNIPAIGPKKAWFSTKNSKLIQWKSSRRQ